MQQFRKVAGHLWNNSWELSDDKGIFDIWISDVTKGIVTVTAWGQKAVFPVRLLQNKYWPFD